MTDENSQLPSRDYFGRLKTIGSPVVSERVWAASQRSWSDMFAPATISRWYVEREIVHDYTYGDRPAFRRKATCRNCGWDGPVRLPVGVTIPQWLECPACQTEHASTTGPNLGTDKLTVEDERARAEQQVADANAERDAKLSDLVDQAARQPAPVLSPSEHLTISQPLTAWRLAIAGAFGASNGVLAGIALGNDLAAWQIVVLLYVYVLIGIASATIVNFIRDWRAA